MKGSWRAVFFKKHTTRIQEKWFTVLNEFAVSETDSGDELEVSAPSAIYCHEFADIPIVVLNSLTTKDETIKNPFVDTTNTAIYGTNSENEGTSFTATCESLMSAFEQDKTLVRVAIR